MKNRSLDAAAPKEPRLLKSEEHSIRVNGSEVSRLSCFGQGCPISHRTDNVFE